MTYQNRAFAFSIGVPTPPLLAVLTGCRNSGTARTMRRVSVLCPAPSSSRYRGSNPSSSHCRGTNPGFGTLLESLSWYKPGVRRPPRVVIVVPTPPRVVIVVQTRGSAPSSSCYRGTNRGFSRLDWSAQPTVPVACSRCSRRGGAILLSTGYGRYRVSTPSPVRVCISPPSTSTT